MNDTELDDVLNKWDAPPVPRGLRERISPERPRRWRFLMPGGLFYGLGAGAATFLVAVGLAAPQSFTGSIPFTVDSEILQPAKDGSMAVTEYRTEYLRDGAPVTLSSTYPDNPLMTLHSHLINSISLMLYPLMREVHGTHGESAFATRVRNGCVWPFAKIIGHETILGHDTVATLIPEKEAYTEWSAPDIGCIVLRATRTETLADGTSRVTWEKQPLKITMYR